MIKKRGQGLPISTIILLILGIVILVFLIIGFTQGWGKFSSYFSKNNVNEVVTNCGLACSMNSQYDFCTSPRDLTSDTEKLKQVTCHYLSLEKTYGVSDCASISCSNVAKVIMPKAIPDPTDPSKTIKLNDPATQGSLFNGWCTNLKVSNGESIYYLDKNNALKSYTCP